MDKMFDVILHTDPDSGDTYATMEGVYVGVDWIMAKALDGAETANWIPRPFDMPIPHPDRFRFKIIDKTERGH